MVRVAVFLAANFLVLSAQATSAYLTPSQVFDELNVEATPEIGEAEFYESEPALIPEIAVPPMPMEQRFYRGGEEIVPQIGDAPVMETEEIMVEPPELEEVPAYDIFEEPSPEAEVVEPEIEEVKPAAPTPSLMGRVMDVVTYVSVLFVVLAGGMFAFKKLRPKPAIEEVTKT